ncbi:MAG TPA: peptidylprolyl isomerase, partial [Acidobacteriota bacterium]|nr:peptidylprolyl isomerase [Acidobacteriota bacterium]
FTIATFLMLAWAPLAGCGRRRLGPDEIERNHIFAEILRREDHRILGTDGFFHTNLLESPYTEVREWCALALGRIGMPSALPWLYEACRSGSAPIRARAAFAIGEIEDRGELKEQALRPDPQAVAELTRLLTDTSTEVRMRAAEALGKVGSTGEAVAILRSLDSLGHDGSPMQRAWLDLAIAALMRLQDPVAFPALEKLALSQDPEIQWRAANALIRLRDRNAVNLFAHILGGGSADARTYAARGIGICEDPSLAHLLFPLLGARAQFPGKPNQLPERVAAVLALGNLKSTDSVVVIASALSAEPIDDAHPEQEEFAIQAATALGNIEEPGVPAVLARLLRAPEPVANSAVIALGRALRANPDRFSELTGGMRRETPPAQRAWCQALGELGGPRAILGLKSMLVSVMDHETEPDAALVLPMILASLEKTGPSDLQEILFPFLGSHDGVVLRVAVAGYRPKDGTRTPWVPIVRAYENIAAGNDLEAKVAVLKRLEPWIHEADVETALRQALKDRQRNARIAAARLLRMAGATDVPEEPGPSETSVTDLTYTILAAARKDRTVAVMETTRGTVEIELFREDAPLTSANFVSLANQGFYNGLSFMRVVPFFVVQGGDPRNDQEGGPGYTIRCEINLRPFERGSIGMALAGKDTGGSQFFITLAPQPHLDGGYTCFGRVISGMEVMDRIVPGDRIKKVWIAEDVTALDFRRY